MISTATLDGAAARSRWTPNAVFFVAMAAVLVLAQFGGIASMVEIWWSTTTYNHGFLVVPASLWLIWRRRAELDMARPTVALSALVPLGVFATASLIGELSGVNIARHVGFVGSLMALVPLCFGWAVARRFAFPVLFLGFMIPAGDFLIAPLQELTADVSVWMLKLTGIAVYREGLFIELPNGLFEVAEACAGLRFLIANIFIAALFAYLSFDSAAKSLAFMALAVIVPIFANCLRAYGIMILAYHTDNALAVGVDHLVYGWVFFAVVMFALLWIGGLMADRNLDDPAAPPADTKTVSVTPRFSQAVAVLLVLSGGPAFAALTERAPAAIPAELDISATGWREVAIDRTAPDHWAPQFATADATALHRFTDGTATVDLFVAFYSHQRDGAEALHFSNRFDDNEIWTRSRLATLDLPNSNSTFPQEARLDTLTFFSSKSEAGRTLYQTRDVASWVWVGGALTANPLKAKLAGLGARLTGASPAAAVIAVSAVHDTPAGRDAAHSAMARLLDALPDPLFITGAR